LDRQSTAGEHQSRSDQEDDEAAKLYKNLSDLKSLARQLSSSSSHVLQPSANILRSLKKARDLQRGTGQNGDFRWDYEKDALWLVAAKAALQTFGVGLATLLNRVSLLNTELSYWSDVLGSNHQIALYTLQTWPLRLWGDACRFYTTIHTYLDSALL
jgi:nuclear-control-of-ATPase protein 2